MEKVKLKKYFYKLRDRIVKHRLRCNGWKQAKPCFDCHYNTLTPIEKAIEEVR